jgi:hypothetical protein
MELTDITARGKGLRSPRLPSLHAALTAAMGEKYTNVLVMIPIFGISDNISGFVNISSEGFDTDSSDVPPPRTIGFFVMLSMRP